MGFVGSFGSCRAIQGGFLLLAMLVSYLVNDTWSLPSLSRSTARSPEPLVQAPSAPRVTGPKPESQHPRARNQGCVSLLRVIHVRRLQIHFTRDLRDLRVIHVPYINGSILKYTEYTGVLWCSGGVVCLCAVRISSYFFPSLCSSSA